MKQPRQPGAGRKNRLVAQWGEDGHLKSVDFLPSDEVVANEAQASPQDSDIAAASEGSATIPLHTRADRIAALGIGSVMGPNIRSQD